MVTRKFNFFHCDMRRAWVYGVLYSRLILSLVLFKFFLIITITVSIKVWFLTFSLWNLLYHYLAELILTEGCMYGALKISLRRPFKKVKAECHKVMLAKNSKVINVKYDNVKYQTVCVNLVWHFKFEIKVWNMSFSKCPYVTVKTWIVILVY